MPYARNSELPPAVRDALPAAAQSVYRNTFNSQVKRGLSEERAHASAWAAVKRTWHKKDGAWVRKIYLAIDNALPPDPAAAVADQLAPTVTNPADEITTDTAKLSPDVEISFTIAKIDEDQNLVFGWLSIVEDGGVPVVDAHDHVIEPAELEKAAYWYVVNSRVAGEMHTRFGFGEGLVESMMFTKEKQAALGINLNKVGWWVGYRVDDAAFAKVKSGELQAFSIGGRAILDDILSEEAA